MRHIAECLLDLASETQTRPRSLPCQTKRDCLRHRAKRDRCLPDANYSEPEDRSNS
jgi:hypothetical protein